MIAYIDDDGQAQPIFIDGSDWFVTHVFNGNDTLEFSFDSRDELYGKLNNETKIYTSGCRGGDNRYVIKNFDDHSNLTTITCSLDLYDWQQTVYPNYYRENTNLATVLSEITPDGWNYDGQTAFPDQFKIGKKPSDGSDISDDSSTDYEELAAVTPLQILDAVSDITGCVFNFSVMRKHLQVIDPSSYTASGDFLSDEVNLTSVGYVANTDSFATRLYPYGGIPEGETEPVNISSVNGGLEYITDNEYSDNIVAVGWSDQRFTIPQHLYDAAVKKLKEISSPVVSYEVEVQQLDRPVWMYMVLTLIDRKHGTRVNHQVVEWKEYGDDVFDTVTLSTVQPSIEEIFNNWDSDESDDDGLTRDDVVGIVNEFEGQFQQELDNVTDKLNGKNGGYFQKIYNDDGQWVELVNLMDSTDINTSKKVWRWNQNGLGFSSNGYAGPYDALALTVDEDGNGCINADALLVGTIRGGQSFWDLSTGDLSIIGRFRTMADTKQEGADDSYGLDINPDAYTFPMDDESNVSYGPIIKVTGGVRAQNPFISFPMYNSQTGLRGGVYLSSGNLLDMPGSVVNNMWSYTDNRSEIYAQSAMKALRKYADGTSSGAIIAATAYQNSYSTGWVRLCGLLDGGTGSYPSTIVKFRWDLSMLQPHSSVKFVATVATPSPQGQYWPVATVRCDMPNSIFGAPQCGAASASGWTTYVNSLPYAVSGASSSSSSGTSLMLTFQEGVGTGLYTIGVLTNAT